MKRINIHTMILIWAAALTPALASVNFTAQTDRTAVAKGQSVTVVATLVSPKAVSAVPRPETNDAFDLLAVNTGQSQSRNISMVNGRIEQRVEHIYKYIYTIMPKVDGAFTFPALTVNIDGTNHSTRPLNFNASGGGEPAQAQAPDIRAYLTISKKTLYPGEQAILTLKIAQKINAPVQAQRGYTGAVEQIEAAFGKEFSLNRLFTSQVTQGQEHIGGELCHTFTLRYSVFGLTPGEYSIPAIVFDYDEIRQMSARRMNPFFQDFLDMDFFGGGRQAVPQKTRTAPFSVTVKPLPKPVPTGFSGSIGKFNISASVEPETVPAGEALTLKITLKGNTRATNVGDPVLPELKNCDVFTPERQTSVDTGDGGFTTRKTYRYLIIPRDDGVLTIDPITYPYLDPESGTFKTAQTNPMTVNVTPGKGGPKEQTRYLTQEEIQQVGHDIRYIKTPEKISHEEERPYRAPYWYLLFPMPFLIFLFVLLYKLQSKRSDENQTKNIRQKALATAVKELNAASKIGTDSEFLGKAATVIEKYISRKLAFPATGRTLEELKDELLKRKIDEQTVIGLTVLIEGINEYRFGGKAFDTRSRSEIISQTIKFLSSMEKTVQKKKTSVSTPSSSSTMTLIMLTLLSAALTFPMTATAAPRQNVNPWFQTANDFYAANSYDSALTYYTKILDAGTRNSAVYYNMGNCYQRLKKPGMARLHYEKAAALSPNDADIQANINFIKSIIVDRVVDGQDDSEFVTTVMYNIHTLLPLNIQLIILCALLFVLSLICSLMLMKKGLARLWLAYGAVLCTLLITVIGISAGYKIYALESKQYAIVMTQSLDAKNQPSGTQTLFTAHEGTKLKISKTVGEWSMVSLPNGASGWVTTASLGRI